MLSQCNLPTRPYYRASINATKLTAVLLKDKLHFSATLKTSKRSNEKQWINHAVVLVYDVFFVPVTTVPSCDD